MITNLNYCSVFSAIFVSTRVILLIFQNYLYIRLMTGLLIFFTWIKKNILYIFNLKVVNDGLNQFGFGLFSCLEFKNFTRIQFIEIFLFVYFHILMDCYRIWIWDLYGYKLFWVSIDLRNKNFIDLIFQSSFGLLEGANLDGSVWDWVIKLTNNLIFLAKKLLKTVFYLV